MKKTGRIQMRIAERKLASWKRAAKKAELNLSQFVESAVDTEVRRIKSSPEPEPIQAQRLRSEKQG